MVRSSRDGLSVIENADLKRLNVVNDGRKRPSWSIEVIRGGEYLRGMQETLYGQSKILLTCYQNRMFLTSIYQVGDKASGLAAREHSLMLNDELFPLPSPVLALANGDVLTHGVFAYSRPSISSRKCQICRSRHAAGSRCADVCWIQDRYSRGRLREAEYLHWKLHQPLVLGFDERHRTKSYPPRKLMFTLLQIRLPGKVLWRGFACDSGIHNR